VEVGDIQLLRVVRREKLCNLPKSTRDKNQAGEITEYEARVQGVFSPMTVREYRGSALHVRIHAYDTRV
jgi:hypothetical protein